MRTRPILALVCWLTLVGLLLGCGASSPFPVLPNVLPTGDWLARFNEFRSWAGLDPVVYDATLQGGGDLHCKWMIVNQIIQHGENPGTECFTQAGDTAGKTSNLAVQAPTPTSVNTPMRGWMTGPFHGIAMIDPRLTATAFSHYVDNNRFPGAFTYGSSLNVTSRRGGLGQMAPIYWPGEGAVVDLFSYDGFESPDPIGPYGLSAPTGLPIYLQLGVAAPYPPTIGATAFSTGGSALPHLVYHGGDYVNSGPPAPGQDGSPQDLARAILAARRCIMLIPHAPLSPGTTYDVSFTTDGVTHAWSFSTTGGGRSTQPRIVRTR